MKQFVKNKQSQLGMTLVEMLVVIAIIGLLAGILMPVLNTVKRKAAVAKARKEISDIKVGMELFKQQYSIWPMTTTARNSGVPDFTYGTYNIGTATYSGNQAVLNPGIGYQANNSELMFILMNELHNTYNSNYVNNPQKKVFLNPPRDNQVDGSPGVGPSRIWLDPWLNPYIVSIDSNYDGVTQDAVYGLSAVSAASGSTGINGLVSKSGFSTNDFVFRGEVMVWSMGPDGKVDSSQKADDDLNKDNVLSWRF